MPNIEHSTKISSNVDVGESEVNVGVERTSGFVAV